MRDQARRSSAPPSTSAATSTTSATSSSAGSDPRPNLMIRLDGRRRSRRLRSRCEGLRMARCNGGTPGEAAVAPGPLTKCWRLLQSQPRCRRDFAASSSHQSETALECSGFLGLSTIRATFPVLRNCRRSPACLQLTGTGLFQPASQMTDTGQWRRRHCRDGAVPCWVERASLLRPRSLQRGRAIFWLPFPRWISQRHRNPDQARYNSSHHGRYRKPSCRR